LRDCSAVAVAQSYAKKGAAIKAVHLIRGLSLYHESIVKLSQSGLQ